MSISSELREYVADNEAVYITPYAAKCLLGIADRIDAEHEQACKEQYACGVEHGIGASIEASMIQEHGFIELPKDADGMPIHVGDVMEWPTTSETFDVVGIGDGVLFYVEDGSEQADWTGASTKRHHRVPTVEDVLRELVSKARALSNVDDEDELVTEFAKRLTLAGEDE